MNKRFRERYRNSKNLQLFVVICGAILFYVLLTNLGVIRNAIGFLIGVFAPVISAAVISFLLYPVVRFFEKKVFGRFRRRKLLHAACVIFTVLLLCVLIILLLYLVIHQLATSVSHLLNNFDSYVQKLSGMLGNLLGDRLEDLTVFGVNLLEVETSSLQEFGARVVAWCTAHYEGIIGGAMSVGSNLMNTVITIMLAVYMLLDAEHLKTSMSRCLRAVLEPDKYVRYSEIWSRSSGIFIRYFGSNLLDALIIGVMCYLFMVIVGLPYSLLIAVLVAVTNLVPTFGPIVGGVIGAFLLLLVHPWGALWFIIYSLVSQFCDANLIKPKLFGDTTGLRPIWVLAAIIVCGGLFGVIGMLLGVPLFAIFAIILDEHIEMRLQRRDYFKEDVDES